MKVESDVLIYFRYEDTKRKFFRFGTLNAQNHKTEVQTSSFCSICFGIDLNRCIKHLSIRHALDRDSGVAVGLRRDLSGFGGVGLIGL
jgi:hypothetical protein